MKNKLDGILNKYLIYSLYFLLFLSLVGNIRSCNTNKNIVKLRQDVDSLNVEIQKRPTEIDQRINSLSDMIYHLDSKDRNSEEMKLSNYWKAERDSLIKLKK
jgi:hypothetical protein